VRNLAQRSAAAAKEIKTLISDSAAKVAPAAAGRPGRRTMSDVVDSVQKVTDIMGEISSRQRRAEHGIEQVNARHRRHGRRTQQNAALVEEAAPPPDRHAGPGQGNQREGAAGQ
jgi:methyl-accepting chemotaxis protein